MNPEYWKEEKKTQKFACDEEMLSLKSVQLCLVRCENNKKKSKNRDLLQNGNKKQKSDPEKKYNFDFLNERLIKKKTKYEFT